jgi:hypothetical protein
LRKKGLDTFHVGVQYAHKEELRQSFLERIHQVIKKTRPGCLVCPQNQGTYYGLAKRAPFIDYSSQEALLHGCRPLWLPLFPDSDSLRTRFRIPFHGCTVCFKDFWATWRLEVAGAMHTKSPLMYRKGAMRQRQRQVPPDGQARSRRIYHVI